VQVLVVEREVAVGLTDMVNRENPTIIKVPDSRYAMAIIAANFYRHPAKELKTIAVTGTKGKTTTTYLIKAVL
jgi:UDP-N-acetylmuramoyl-L-alanyl-D-glutamate--2,6-diaminopimelate ligase